MPIKRIFLGIDAPGLRLAAEYLFDKMTEGSIADLGQCVAVLPGSRAGRRLLEILVEISDQRQLVLTPPHITTVGHLPELLYQPKRPFADEQVQQLVWTDVLRSFRSSALREVIAEPPDNDDFDRWLELGRLLHRLHRQLASDGLSFGDVVESGNRVAGFNESLRWKTLARIQQKYLTTLDGLQLWDRQTARRVAVAEKECQTDRQIVLIGMVDIERLMRQMVDQVADNVTALVFAPEEWADRFDSHGCLLPDAWQTAMIDIADERITQADAPEDQADATVEQIAEFEGRYAADEITVGMPDARIVPQVERALSECNLPSRYGAGRPLAESAVCQLLEAVAGYMDSRRYPQYAALVRHPDIETLLRRRGIGGDWLTDLDRFYNDFFPTQVTRETFDDSQATAALRQVYDAIDKLTHSLQKQQRMLNEWSPAITELLLEVYGERVMDRERPADRMTLRACEEVQKTLDSYSNIPAQLCPKRTAAETIRMVLEQVSSAVVTMPVDCAAIELVGWLELPLDDAPALVVASFNEGFVPTSVNADLFLPDSMRHALSLDDNARRFARDAYALSTLLAPWRDLRIIVGRRDADANPLSPSRLLFATDIETMAKRASQFFHAHASSKPKSRISGKWQPERDDFGFEVPEPKRLDEPPSRIRVTGFRDYLACPYRYYLRHILRLEPLTDDAEEMDGGIFGTLAHDVLDDFAHSEDAESSDVENLQRMLNHLLNRRAQNKFGKHPTTAIAVQIEQLRTRLKAFASWQADWFASGWRIEHAEVPRQGEYAELLVDGEPMLISGRIDRIDVHRETGRRIILDYKTTDSMKTPEQFHRSRGKWVDLQLPLYRHLAKTVGVDGAPQLAYVLLPKDTTKIGLAMAEWTEEELAEGDEVARDVVRQIRAQRFWPPSDPPPDFSEDFAPICLDGVFGKPKYERVL